MSRMLVAAITLAFAQAWNPFAVLSQPGLDVTACLARGAPTVIRLGDDSVLYCGRLTAAGVANFRNILRTTDQELRIASLGGDLDAPLAMAELVRDRRLRVSIIGPCISGCASFVFVAGSVRSVSPRGVLGLHNTAASALFLVQQAHLSFDSDRDPLIARARRERELYRSLGINERLLMEPQARVETRCIEPGSTDPRTGETEFHIYSRHGIWVPTRAQWRALGVPFGGFSPQSAAEARRVLADSVPEPNNNAADIVESAGELRALPEVYLADVRRCAGAHQLRD